MINFIILVAILKFVSKLIYVMWIIRITVIEYLPFLWEVVELVTRSVFFCKFTQKFDIFLNGSRRNFCVNFQKLTKNFAV